MLLKSRVCPGTQGDMMGCTCTIPIVACAKACAEGIIMMTLHIYGTV